MSETLAERLTCFDGVRHPVVVEVRDEAVLAECVAVIRAAFQTVADEFGFTEAEAPTNAAFLTLDRLRVARTRGDRILALRVDGGIVGSVSLRSRTGATTVELERLAVAPPFRHRGYGGVLLERSCALAAQGGASTVSVGIIAANTMLKGWYEAHGFTVTTTRAFDHLPFTVCYLERPAVRDQRPAAGGGN